MSGAGRGTVSRKAPSGRIAEVHVEHARFPKSMLFDSFMEENTATKY